MSIHVDLKVKGRKQEGERAREEEERESDERNYSVYLRNVIL